MKHRIAVVLVGGLIVVAVVLILAGNRKPPPGEAVPAQSQPAPQEAAPAQGRPAPRIEKVREPAVAGQFYPAEAQALTEMIDKFMADVSEPPIKNLRGLVCPHAGYIYSGPIAADGFKQLVGREVETVIIMAPSHYAAFSGASVADATAFRTPLGLVEVSAKAQELAKVSPFVREAPCDVPRPPPWAKPAPPAAAPSQGTPHTWEHSLEVELPFLQRTLKNFSIVPIVFGDCDPREAAKALAPYVDDKTILVASSDLSHYLRYDEAWARRRRKRPSRLNVPEQPIRGGEPCTA